MRRVLTSIGVNMQNSWPAVKIIVGAGALVALLLTGQLDRLIDALIRLIAA